MRGVDFVFMRVEGFDIGPEVLQNIEHDMDIADLRDVFDDADSLRENGRRKDCDRGVFGAADGHRAFEWLAALDNKYIVVVQAPAPFLYGYSVFTEHNFSNRLYHRRRLLKSIYESLTVSSCCGVFYNTPEITRPNYVAVRKNESTFALQN